MTPLTDRQQRRLVAWMHETHVSAQAPADWAASGECARLLAQCLLRYATVLYGDLADQEVRDDLRCVRIVVQMALDAADEQAAEMRAKMAETRAATRRRKTA